MIKHTIKFKNDYECYQYLKENFPGFEVDNSEPSLGFYSRLKCNDVKFTSYDNGYLIIYL